LGSLDQGFDFAGRQVLMVGAGGGLLFLSRADK
jgi:hypothetical protein